MIFLVILISVIYLTNEFFLIKLLNSPLPLTNIFGAEVYFVEFILIAVALFHKIDKMECLHRGLKRSSDKMIEEESKIWHIFLYVKILYKKTLYDSETNLCIRHTG